MRFPRQLAQIVAFILIAVSFPQPFFSLTPPKQYQPKHPQRVDALAVAINELLVLNPIEPGQTGEIVSSADTSEGEEKPPADDAPIQKLIDYWSGDSNADKKNTRKPSDKVRERLLEAVERRPKLIFGLSNIIPENTDTHDRLYKLLEDEQENELEWKPHMRKWLQHHSRYFRDDLIDAVRRADVYLSDAQDNLQALARLDWETAKPILETFASSGIIQLKSIALSILYQNTHQNNDSVRADKYRVLLQAIVANRESPPDARKTALSSLVATEWNEQKDWVVLLFADPTLNNLHEDNADLGDFGILANLLDSNAEKWLDVANSLVGHHDRTVHESAVRCLVKFLGHEEIDINKKREVAQKLIPSLTGPNQSDSNIRHEIIQSLTDLQAPELIPGLLWVVYNDEEQDNRASAVVALAQYRDPRIIPAMRHALEQEKDEDWREMIVTAMAESGGLTDVEMVRAIEAYAKLMARAGGEQMIEQAKSGDLEEPLSMDVSLGRILVESETIEITEGSAINLIERAKTLRKTNPAVAWQILRAIEGFHLRAIDLDIVERIGEGWVDVETITTALDDHEDLQMSAGSELYRLIKGGGYAAGIAAAILDDDREAKRLLEGKDAKAQFALLACSRYMRDKLPLELVGILLNSPKHAIAKAAESYLEMEDSATARKMVLSKHRDEAYILGFRRVFHYSLNAVDYVSLRGEDWEEKLRREIKSRNGPQEIYAVLMTNLPETRKGVVVRVRNGKGEISVYETEGRRNVRWLTASEFEELKNFTSQQEVEDLGPEIDSDVIYRGSTYYQYLRLTIEGGRRIVLGDLQRIPKNPTLHEELSGLFYRLSMSGEFTTRYAIEDKIPGVEILIADKNQKALMVCGEGSGISVFVQEREVEKRPDFAESGPDWREYSNGKLGKVTPEPSACPTSDSISMSIWNMGVDRYKQLHLPTRSGDAWVYSSSGKDVGVSMIKPGAEPVMILSGPYIYPLITPDGKWLVAVKTMEGGGKPSYKLIRHNLQTGKEFTVDTLAGYRELPCVYIASHAKVLLCHHALGSVELEAINNLLDPETGIVQPAKGEFSPLIERFGRELQPTGNLNEYWAAISDQQKRVTRLGRYNTRNFVFTPLVELPELILRSSDFWVDVAASKIWLTYKGQLLRIPLPEH